MPDRCEHSRRAPKASGTASGSGSTTRRPRHRSGRRCGEPVEHLQTFRDAAHDLDVVHLHYDDLKADLDGQMRQLAARLGIDVGEHRWPRLVQAATFESMRSRADTTVPDAGPEQWIDPAAFFSHGTSGQGRDLLDDADLGRYAARCAPSRATTSSTGCTARRSNEIPPRRVDAPRKVTASA